MSATTFARRRTLLAAILLGLCLAAAAAAAGLEVCPGSTADAAPQARSSAAADAAPQIRSSAAVDAPPSATLSASFHPERLGRRTTLSFGFRIAAPAGLLPPALTAIDLRYPRKLGIALSGLGLVTCTAVALEASGLQGCQADSIMGFGDATAEISLGPDVVAETVPITILRAPDEENHIALLFDAVGTAPLNTTAVFAGALLPASSPFGGQMSINAPLIPSVPGAPDVAIVQLHATLGPNGVTYYEHVAGETLGYQPPGILLPPKCPRGGFPFAAQFSFVNGAHASARDTEPCPRADGAAGAGGGVGTRGF